MKVIEPDALAAIVAALHVTEREAAAAAPAPSAWKRAARDYTESGRLKGDRPSRWRALRERA
jgi:hypothetical protein